MDSPLDKVKGKIQEYKDDISDRKSRIQQMEKVLRNYKTLWEKSDNELRVKSSNERIYDPDDKVQKPLEDCVDSTSMDFALGFTTNHLRMMNDPLVDGILDIKWSGPFRCLDNDNTYDQSLLGRIIQRQVNMGEYIDLISGEKPVCMDEREERDVYIVNEQHPQIVAAYMMSHDL